MTLDAPAAPSPAVRALLDEALAAALAQRGGGDLLAALRLGDDPAADLCARGALRVLSDEGGCVGLAIVRDGVLAALYVAPARRREGVGSRLARAVLESDGAAERRVGAAGGPGDEVALRVAGAEGATAHDARRVGGRRAGRVGGGGGGTFIPRSFASSGMAPALCSATARLASSSGMPVGLDVAPDRRVGRRGDDLAPRRRVLLGRQGLGGQRDDSGRHVGADARGDVGRSRDQAQRLGDVLGAVMAASSLPSTACAARRGAS